MYNTAQWIALRKIQLSKHPLCAGCEAEGIVTAAIVVDHVFPWKQISKESFFINKFQSLCYAHHAEKTQYEQRGIYKRYGTPTLDLQKSDYMMLLG
jgi:5-methylcytosine-specific restriction protein A